MKLAYVLLLLFASGFGFYRMQRSDSGWVKLCLGCLSVSSLLIFVAIWCFDLLTKGLTLQTIGLLVAVVVGLKKKSTLLTLLAVFPLLLWICRAWNFPGQSVLLSLNVISMLCFALLIKGRSLYPQEFGYVAIVGVISVFAVILNFQ